LEIKLSKKDKKLIEKELSKQLKEDNVVAQVLKNNKNNKLKLKVKVTTFLDPETKEKRFGGCVELFESKSNKKLLDGWNIDLGATDKFDVLAGISKDFNVNESEFSIGGYIDVTDLGKRLFSKNKDKTGVKVKIGLSKTF